MRLGDCLTLPVLATCMLAPVLQVYFGGGSVVSVLHIQAACLWNRPVTTQTDTMLGHGSTVGNTMCFCCVASASKVNPPVPCV